MKMYSNIDINSVCTPFFNSVAESESFSEELLYPLVDMYRDTFVTDILFCIFGQYSAVDSSVWTTYADKYLQTEAEGKPVDYKEKYHGIYKINKEYGVDPYAVWFRRCWDIGIHPWISLRMNDCHHNDFLKSEFYYEAKKNGWMIGEDYGYFAECFDYSVEIVREKMLSYLKEQLLRYDVFGVELDFMRDIYCFDYLHADMTQCVGMMNDFMREAKKIVTEAEEMRKHPIQIAVRLNRDIDQSLAFGFDARTWAKEALLDVVIPSPRWAHVDGEIPYDVWKRELPGMEIPGCMETLLTNENGLGFMTAESARGLAAGMLSSGADGIYLFNYFGQNFVRNPERDREVHRTCGTLEEIYRHPVRCVLRGQEYLPMPKGCEISNPLPLSLKSGERGVLSLRTGEIPPHKKITLILGLDGGDISQLSVRFNQQPCDAFIPYSLEIVDYLQNPTQCYGACVKETSLKVQEIEVVCHNTDANVVWVELKIE